MKKRNNKILKNMTKLILSTMILGIVLYAFETYGVAEKFGRFLVIVDNISYNLANKKYAYELNHEEFKDINISEISYDPESFIDIRMSESISQHIKADEIRAEERPTHIKTVIKEVDLVLLENLPQTLKPLQQYLHEPFKIGACQICHRDEVNNPEALVDKEIKNICYQCHKTRYTKEFDHKPAKDGKCLDCHDPHQSNTKKLLKADSINNLCMKCHDKKSSFNEKAKDTFIDMDQPVKHEPILKKSCLECHEAHTADNKSLLRLEKNIDLCLNCHKDVKDKTKHYKFKHSGANNTKKRCLECHNPHATKHKSLLINDPIQTCLKCHDKEIKSNEDTRTIMNIKKHLDENPNWHTPMKNSDEKGACSLCHSPHGSDNPNILRKSFTRKFYANFESKDFFCFTCHDQKKVTIKNINRPEDISVTNFKDGTVNLHNLHVSDRKGKNCIACHDEHASKYMHLIRDYTNFNGTQFPLRYIKTKNGGSCASACHKRFEYDRVNPRSIGR